MNPVKVLIAGGPGSGKSTIVRILNEIYAGRINSVPEIATMVLEGGFPPPGEVEDPPLLIPFQRILFASMVEFEAAAMEIARRAGIPVVICDRGRLDGEAYLSGGREQYNEMLGITDRVPHLMAYDHVIYFESLASHDPSLWDRSSGNGRRMEDSAEIAADLDARTRAAWEDHPNFTFVSCEEGLEGKLLVAMILVGELIRSA